MSTQDQAANQQVEHPPNANNEEEANAAMALAHQERIVSEPNPPLLFCLSLVPALTLVSTLRTDTNTRKSRKC